MLQIIAELVHGDKISFFRFPKKLPGEYYIYNVYVFEISSDNILVLWFYTNNFENNLRVLL